MAKKQVILELEYNKDLSDAAFSAALAPGQELDRGAVPKVAGVTFDKSYAPVNLPGVNSPNRNGYPVRVR